ncbi:MAG: SDR family oxidoreductase [Ruminococcaceae bacterium]|nr:SDR family oxidoreductase [Oscillospiraceae bacterium]
MKTALITGSARGIGRAIAIRLAKDGYHVIIHGTSVSENALKVKKIIEENGGSAQIMACDLTDIEKVKAFCKELPPVDALVLNASLQYRTPWQEISVEACYEQLNCNYVASLLLIQATVPHMKEAGWGRIVTIGSVQEAKPHPDMLIYSASKAAQTNMMQSLSLQLADSGITVNNVAPGVIYTDRNMQALADAAYAEKVRNSIPVGFYGEPEDCAGIVSLLCSQEGRYITGQSIYVDGGKGIQ